MAKNTNTYGPAERHFDIACQYKNAADLLHAQFYSGTNQLPIREPIYYLYHHAVELILKSFLHARHRGFRNTHDVNVLYSMCCNEGMKVRDGHHFEVKNCIDLLRAGNRNHFYRYPVENKHAAPSLTWTCDVVTRLIEAVTPLVKSNAPRPSTIRASLGKPTYSPLPR